MSTAELTLKCVQILHRHGHRNYLEDYANIQNLNIKCKNIFFGTETFLNLEKTGDQEIYPQDFQYILNNPEYFKPVFNGTQKYGKNLENSSEFKKY